MSSEEFLLQGKFEGFVGSTKQVDLTYQPDLFPDMPSLPNFVVQAALRHMGEPGRLYRGINKGQDQINGYDCSGLVLAILKETKQAFPSLILPDDLNTIRHADKMYRYLGEHIDPANRAPGDLLFISNNASQINHMGIYCGEDKHGNGYFIQSPGTDASVVGLRRFEVKPIPYENLAKHRSQNYRVYEHNPVGYKRLMVGRVFENERYPEHPVRKW